MPEADWAGPEQSRNQLYAALAAAQGAVMAALKETEGQVGTAKRKYADLASCWDACREKLSSNGLCVIQIPVAEGTRVSVTTILGHKSGQEISGTLTLVSQVATPQGIGSAITYGRRYGLCSMVGIAPEDDDGEAASSDKKADRAIGAIAAKQVADRKLAALSAGQPRREVDKAEAAPIDEDLGPVPEFPTELEVELLKSVEAEKKKERSAIFKMRDAFGEIKPAIGEERYYGILALHKFKKANEITDLDLGKDIYKQMLSYLPEGNVLRNRPVKD